MIIIKLTPEQVAAIKNPELWLEPASDPLERLKAFASAMQRAGIPTKKVLSTFEHLVLDGEIGDATWDELSRWIVERM